MWIGGLAKQGQQTRFFRIVANETCDAAGPSLYGVPSLAGGVVQTNGEDVKINLELFSSKTKCVMIVDQTHCQCEKKVKRHRIAEA